MVAFDQFSDWTVLFEVAYVTLDALTNVSRMTVEETARRIATVVVLSLIGSSILEVFYSEVSQETAVFQGPVLTSAWIASLFFIFVFSWTLYHRMLRHSQLIQSERVNLVELVAKRVNDALIPAQKQIDGLQQAIDSEKASADQRSSKLAGAVDGLKKSVGEATRSINPLTNWMELWNGEMRRMMHGYTEWAEAHKNDVATIYLLSTKLESLIERAAVVEEELDELSSHQDESPEDYSDREVGGDNPSVGPPSTTGTVEPPHKLTREDGLANREKGNQALMRFYEHLRGLGKDPKMSLLHGVPDLQFLDGEGRLRYVAAYKSLTLSTQEGSVRQRWIPKAKLVAESKLALREGKPLILFVENLANGRIWAKVIAADELRSFRGITTPLMLVNEDPTSERDCKDSLTSVLELL